MTGKLMRKSFFSIFGIGLLSLLGLVGCTGQEDVSEIPFFKGEDLTPVWVSAVSRGSTRDTIDLRKIGSFALTDQSGTVVSDSSMHGQIYVASFFFVECKDICPTLRTRLTSVQKAFGVDEVAILSHSVMPEADSVERLAAYSKINNINAAQWHLLTGDKNSIYNLATSSYGVKLTRQTDYAKGEPDFLHTETFYLVDGDGYIRGLYNGTLQFETERLLEDARLLVQEKLADELR